MLLLLLLFSLIGESKILLATTNQKHNSDLGSNTSLVWNFCSRFTDVILRGKPVVPTFFSGYRYSDNVKCPPTNFLLLLVLVVVIVVFLLLVVVVVLYLSLSLMLLLPVFFFVYVSLLLLSLLLFFFFYLSLLFFFYCCCCCCCSSSSSFTFSFTEY